MALAGHPPAASGLLRGQSGRPASVDAQHARREHNVNRLCDSTRSCAAVRGASGARPEKLCAQRRVRVRNKRMFAFCLNDAGAFGLQLFPGLDGARPARRLSRASCDRVEPPMPTEPRDGESRFLAHATKIGSYDHGRPRMGSDKPDQPATIFTHNGAPVGAGRLLCSCYTHVIALLSPCSVSHFSC
jgi:hypothetical protein